jgi:hypothetical protein
VGRMAFPRHEPCEHRQRGADGATCGGPDEPSSAADGMELGTAMSTLASAFVQLPIRRCGQPAEKPLGFSAIA